MWLMTHRLQFYQLEKKWISRRCQSCELRLRIEAGEFNLYVRRRADGKSFVEEAVEGGNIIARDRGGIGAEETGGE